MHISPISQSYTFSKYKIAQNRISSNETSPQKSTNTTKLPSINEVTLPINFKAERKTVPDVDYFSYRTMSEPMKRFLRKRCTDFNEKVKTSELENQNKKYLPLMKDEDMKKFVEICSQFNKLKDDPILCLGRSPKWFLNTSLWMKDGIDNYKFVAFSKFWFRKQGDELVKMGPMFQPTPEEKKAYKKYVKISQIF